MIESWPTGNQRTSNQVYGETKTRYVVLELGTVLEALKRDKVDKVVLHTEYGAVKLFSGETPEDTTQEMWVWQTTLQSTLQRCRVAWNAYHGVREVSVFGEV